MSTLVMIRTNGMGHGDADLCEELILKYLSILERGDTLPETIAFYTEGVRLVVDGSPVLDLLASLEQRGVRLMACKTCLDYLGLTGHVRVGEVGGMPGLVEAQLAADKVITI